SECRSPSHAQGGWHRLPELRPLPDADGIRRDRPRPVGTCVRKGPGNDTGARAGVWSTREWPDGESRLVCRQHNHHGLLLRRIAMRCAGEASFAGNDWTIVQLAGIRLVDMIFVLATSVRD